MPAGGSRARPSAATAPCASDQANSGTSAGGAGHAGGAGARLVARGTISRSIPVLMIHAGASSKNISGKSISTVTST